MYTYYKPERLFKIALLTTNMKYICLIIYDIVGVVDGMPALG
jgi:hypothetical protein